jgi:hypothetical protein
MISVSGKSELLIRDIAARGHAAFAIWRPIVVARGTPHSGLITELIPN